MKKQIRIAAAYAMVASLSLSGCTKDLSVYATHRPAPLLKERASGPNVPPMLPPRVPLGDWMATVPDNYSLAQLSLPGAHNAGARYEPIGGTAKCQTLTINEQLNAGIRFLDIRCRHMGNAFAIYHGSIDQNLSFDDVLTACTNFLNNHPGECIIMSVKEECHPSENTQSFEQTFDAYTQRYANKWYLGATVPAMRQVRGKIVLLRRFRAGNMPKGIDATGWERNATFTINNGPANIRVQDQYKVSDNRAKWFTSTVLLTEAKSVNTAALYINFTSGYKSRRFFSIPNIKMVSRAMSSHITNFFTANPQGRFGIIAMDFADAAKASLIITTNFQPASSQPKDSMLTYALNKTK